MTIYTQYLRGISFCFTIFPAQFIWGIQDYIDQIVIKAFVITASQVFKLYEIIKNDNFVENFEFFLYYLESNQIEGLQWKNDIANTLHIYDKWW